MDDHWIDEILREVTGEFAAQYRMRNEATEPYSIKLYERQAEDAIDQAKAALKAEMDKRVLEGQLIAKTEAAIDIRERIANRIGLGGQEGIWIAHVNDFIEENEKKLAELRKLQEGEK